jgi:excisionase family DNA binding protein
MDSRDFDIQAIGKFATVRQAAKLVGLSEKSIRRLISRREIEVFRPLPGRILVSLEDLVNFIRSTARSQV